MNKIFYIIFFFILPYSTNSQIISDKNLQKANNPEKINIYLKYARENIEDSDHLSIYYLKKGLNLSEKFHIKNDSTAEINYLLSRIYYNNNDFDTAYIYIENSIETAHEKKNYSILANSYYVLGNIRYYQNEFTDANNFFQTALKYAGIIHNNTLIADILIDKAYTHDILSEKDSALQMLEKAVDISKQTNYKKGVGKASIAAGNIYYGINDFDKALTYYKKALKAAKEIKNSTGIATAYKNIGTIYIEKEKYELALKNLKLSLEEYKKTKNHTALSNVYNDFAIIYSKQNKHKKAVEYLQKSIKISKQYGRKEDLAIVYNVSGDVYRNFGYYKISNYYLDSCISIAEKIKYGLMLQKSYQTYSNNLNNLKKFKKSLDYYKKYNDKKDSVMTDEFQNRLAQFEIKFKTAQKEKEILQLKDKELLDKANNRLLIIGIISLIIIFILIIIRIQTKRKKDSEIQKQKIIVHQKEKELVKAKLIQKEIEEKQLKEEIEFKTKQLASHALNMMQKNKLLQELSEHISLQSKNMDELGKKELNTVKRRLEAGLNVDKDWDLFKIYFEQINESFFDKLTEINSRLTSNDFRLCALTKLNLSLKETASVLNISPESVKNARYRLKKKLSLSAKQDLNQFVNSM